MSTNSFPLKMDSKTHFETQERMRIELVRLGNREKQIFKETFPLIFGNAKRNGLVLFARYFSEHPQYKNIWPQFRELQDSALLASNQLANHCSVYMCGLHQIVESLDDQENLMLLTAKIAKSHVKWNISKQHILNMLPGVSDVLKSSLGDDLSSEILSAWSLLYDVIGNILEIQKKLVVQRNF